MAAAVRLAQWARLAAVRAPLTAARACSGSAAGPSWSRYSAHVVPATARQRMLLRPHWAAGAAFAKSMGADAGADTGTGAGAAAAGQAPEELGLTARQVDELVAEPDEPATGPAGAAALGAPTARGLVGQYTRLITLVAWSPDPSPAKAEALFEELVDLGAVPAPRTYSALAAVYCAVNRVDMAIDVLERMRDDRVAVTEEALTTVLFRVLKTREPENAFRIAAMYDQFGVVPSTAALTGLVEASVRCSPPSLDRGLNVVLYMAEARLAPNTRFLNMFLRLCLRTRHWDLAVALCRATKLVAPPSDGLDLRAVLRPEQTPAASLLGPTDDVATATQFFEEHAKELQAEFAAESPEDKVHTYNTAIHVAVKVGLVDRAFALYDEMLKRGLLPSKHTCTLIMDGCAAALRRGDSRAPALADEAYRIAREIRAQLGELDRPANLALFNVCIAAGDLASARDVIETMVAVNQTPSPRMYGELAMALVRAQDAGGAIALLEGAAAAYPQWPLVRSLFSRFVADRNFDAAVVLLDSPLATSGPGAVDPGVVANLADALENAGDAERLTAVGAFMERAGLSRWRTATNA